MARDNTVTISGNLTRDPELRFTQGGTAVASFGLAWNPPRKQDQTGNWVDQDPHFFDVTCWAELAEHVAELSKGTRVTVVGNLEYRKWQDNDGNPRTKVDIRADEVGPSLRWATADVTRAERGGNGGTPARTGGGGPTKGYEQDEEPF